MELNGKSVNATCIRTILRNCSVVSPSFQQWNSSKEKGNTIKVIQLLLSFIYPIMSAVVSMLEAKSDEL